MSHAETQPAREGRPRARSSRRCEGGRAVRTAPAARPYGRGARGPTGLSSREALMILRKLGGLDIVGADVVEVAPAYDHADITSIAGAAVLQHYLGLLAEKVI